MKKPAVFVVRILFLKTAVMADNKKETERAENAGKVMTEILQVSDNIPQDLLDKAECVCGASLSEERGFHY